MQKFLFMNSYIFMKEWRQFAPQLAQLRAVRLQAAHREAITTAVK